MWFGLVSLRVEGVYVSLGLKNHMALVYPQERDDVEMSEEELLMLFSSDVQRRGPPKFSGSDGAPRYPWCARIATSGEDKHGGEIWNAVERATQQTNRGPLCSRPFR